MADSKTQWVKNKVHTVKLSSGTQVEIQLPNLPELVKGGNLPNKLLEVATKRLQQQDITAELISDLADFNRYLVAKTVVKPEIAEEDVPNIPYEDVEMIVAFANRERDVDAVGHHIAGLEVDEDFRRFRGLPDSQEGLLSS